VTHADPQVREGILELLVQLADDWEYDGEIGPETAFIADLGLESLDIVVLGTMLQERYGRLPFPEFLDEIGQRPIEQRDLTVDELVVFVCEHRQTILEEA
jgi:acyl carrier protein